MHLSENKQEVKCHECDKWISVRGQTWVDDPNILCLRCNAHLGYTWDLPEVFGDLLVAHNGEY